MCGSSTTVGLTLTSEEKPPVQGAADVAVIAGRGIDRLVTATEKGLPTLAKSMEVYTPTAEEMQTFRDVAIPAAKAFFRLWAKTERNGLKNIWQLSKPCNKN